MFSKILVPVDLAEPEIAQPAVDRAVALAKASGRPIVPIAYASSRRIDVKSWDRSTINLPFSRAVIAVGEPVHVPEEADAALLEAKRVLVEETLNEATERAYRIVDRRNG